MPHDPDVLRDRLRRDTARMLRIDDLRTMTAAQEVRLERAMMLRLELDDCQTKKLNNQPFDLKSFVIASESLERLVGGNPEHVADQHDFAADAEALAALLCRQAEALEQRREAQDQQAAEQITGSEKVPLMPSGQYLPIAKQRAAEAPAAELMPEGSEPPTSNVHHSYVDHDVIEPSPLRTRSMNNPNSQPTPRKPTEASTTYGAFAEYSARRASGFRRFDPPEGF
jgi:hypothetical protein